MSGAPTRTALALIRAYQTGVSPGLGPRCRFEPTCSAYAYQAVARFGVIRGVWLAVRRLGRCRPGSAGGFDPPPDTSAQPEHTLDVDSTGSGSPHAA